MVRRVEAESGLRKMGCNLKWPLRGLQIEGNSFRGSIF